jgi:hypothetical protein
MSDRAADTVEDDAVFAAFMRDRFGLEPDGVAAKPPTPLGVPVHDEDATLDSFLEHHFGVPRAD